MKKFFTVFREIFGDIHYDGCMIGKIRRSNEEKVFCEEHEVKALVNELNSRGIVVLPKDNYYNYYNYWRYIEVGHEPLHKPLTIDELRDRYEFYLNFTRGE